MNLEPSKPILYLITPGASSEATAADSPQFHNLLAQIANAVDCGVELIQIREKLLSDRVLFQLSERAVELARGSSTRVLINDRADVARASGADGVHLTTRSIKADTIRRMFGADFLIGVSTHSRAEVFAARDRGADFVVLGPVFKTTSKVRYGPTLGLDEFAEIARKVRPFPVLALGGIGIESIETCLDAGAAGIAGISLFSDVQRLKNTCEILRAFGS